jgi:TonB family protein
MRNSPWKSSDSTSQGITLYERGDSEAAIKVLREAVRKSKGDAKAWHYLGLAFVRQGNLKAGRESLGKAIDLRAKPLSQEFYRGDGELRDDQVVKLKDLLRDQIEGQSKLLEILTDKQELEKGQLNLETWKIEADCVEQNTKPAADGHTVLSKNDMRIQKPRILFKAEPAFPEAARQAKASGGVILRAIFAPDGSVRNIEVVQSSGYGMTEEAIKVANLVRFQPASICGKPVNFPIQLEYSFVTQDR